MMGRKVNLFKMSMKYPERRRTAHLMAMKKTALITARSLMLHISAFWYTFQRQYKNAASHRNHSSNAINITVPTMATYTICGRVSIFKYECYELIERTSFTGHGSEMEADRCVVCSCPSMMSNQACKQI